MRTIEITTQDGLTIVGSLFEPADTPKAGVIINSATAVSRGFYKAFAEHLCQEGYLVVTYDYRGIGDSRNSAIEAAKLSMRAWGESDFEAVIQWSLRSFPQHDWHCIGHSVGGQLIGLAVSNASLKSVYCVASQNGYWKNWGRKQQPKILLTWYATIPLFSFVLGYVPKFILGEPLPGPIATEWARWCRNPHFICDEDGQPLRTYFSQCTQKMRFLAIEDDLDFAPLKAVKALHDFYADAEREIRVIEPGKYALKAIGHFGFFKRQNKEILWPDTLAWLARFQ